MPVAFHPITLNLQNEPLGYTRPQQSFPEQVTPTNPAVDVMTDLTCISAVTVSPAKKIDDALQTMIHKGVRLLLVEDLQTRVIGLIIAKDIQGEKPLLFIQEAGIRHADVLVRDIMTPMSAIEAMDFADVSHSTVGDIVKTLTEAGKQHALVIESQPANQAKSIRGIFSTSQIGRQMGIEINPSEMAQTFAELRMSIDH